VLWAAGGLIGITALLAGLILRQPSTKPAPGPPPPPVVVAAPRTAAQAAPVAPVSPTRDVWRVIAYTFAKSKDAEKRAERINEKWPDAHAEVFSIVSGRSPFLVAVGGRMNRDEAQRFRKRAVAHGLPSGAYSQNFNH
jgi:eukaryotic-like serine/threonine-protein kinase